jgi:hypothetical protein
MKTTYDCLLYQYLVDSGVPHDAATMFVEDMVEKVEECIALSGDVS